MVIALDYDNTYTADPALWEGFIKIAKDRGHIIKICTMRFPHESLPELGVDVIYTSRKAKITAITADIWIDDSPNWIFQDAII